MLLRGPAYLAPKIQSTVLWSAFEKYSPIQYHWSYAFGQHTSQSKRLLAASENDYIFEKHE
jgi:hypothetical protein